MLTPFRNTPFCLITLVITVTLSNVVMAEKHDEKNEQARVETHKELSEETREAEIASARQESQIWTTYALSPYLRANDLKVSVVDGKATLSGTVAEEVSKELASAIAMGVTGITEVDNKIEVRANYLPTQNERGYGDRIDDLSISSTIKSKLLWSKYVDSRAVKIETREGKVTLSGSATTPEDKALAGRLATATRGVRAVDNNLVVKGDVNTPTKASIDVANTLSDSWITAKVKSTLLYSSNVTGSNIEVSTNDGVVELSGKLDTGAERALAIELTQNVRGVKRVTAKSLSAI
jgi:hyperosmotically inducible protein